MSDAITLTDSAAEQVLELLSTVENADETFLRVYVAGGGCAGFNYGLALDVEKEADDTFFEDKGIRIAIDSVSLKYVNGSTIDYVPSGLSGAFKVDNPNAKSGCGCGQSFSTEDGKEATGGCGGCQSRGA